MGGSNRGACVSCSAEPSAYHDCLWRHLGSAARHIPMSAHVPKQAASDIVGQLGHLPHPDGGICLAHFSPLIRFDLRQGPFQRRCIKNQMDIVLNSIRKFFSSPKTWSSAAVGSTLLGALLPAATLGSGLDAEISGPKYASSTIFRCASPCDSM